jgi:hypothetical protein
MIVYLSILDNFFVCKFGVSSTDYISNALKDDHNIVFQEILHFRRKLVKIAPNLS